MSRYDYADPGLDPEYCDGLSPEAEPVYIGDRTITLSLGERATLLECLQTCQSRMLQAAYAADYDAMPGLADFYRAHASRLCDLLERLE